MLQISDSFGSPPNYSCKVDSNVWLVLSCIPLIGIFIQYVGIHRVNTRIVEVAGSQGLSMDYIALLKKRNIYNMVGIFRDGVTLVLIITAIGMGAFVE